MLNYLKEKLFIKNPYKESFFKMNVTYNSYIGIFTGIFYIIIAGLSLLSAYMIYKAEVLVVANDFLLVVIFYAASIVCTLVTIIILLVIRKKDIVKKWLAEFIVVLQICCALLFLTITSHFETAAGVKNINMIMISMFAIVFFFRLKLVVTFAIEMGITITTVIFLYIEKQYIINFQQSLMSILISGIITCIAAYLYWRSRLEDYIVSNDSTKLATYDALTKILNRRGFDLFYLRAWNDAIKSKSQLAIFIVDIDYFKNYNDLYGHVKGDECLIMVADALSKSIRKEDFVARYGGEEFAIVMHEADYKAVMSVSERIFTNIRNCNIQHMGSTAAQIVTVSIGCMLCYPVSNDIAQHEFVELADEALYMAKQSGRKRFIMHPKYKEN